MIGQSHGAMTSLSAYHVPFTGTDGQCWQCCDKHIFHLWKGNDIYRNQWALEKRTEKRYHLELCFLLYVFTVLKLNKTTLVCLPYVTCLNNLFCLINSLKHKHIQYTKMRKREKKQLLWRNQIIFGIEQLIHYQNY